MYFCRNCKNIIEREDMLESNYIQESWNQPEECTLLTPCCEDENFAQAERCKECGYWVIAEDLKEGACKFCREEK